VTHGVVILTGTQAWLVAGVVVAVIVVGAVIVVWRATR
jgi:type IV secretory pathway TrbD component